MVSLATQESPLSERTHYEPTATPPKSWAAQNRSTYLVVIDWVLAKHLLGH